jgi:hypothetical protein
MMRLVTLKAALAASLVAVTLSGCVVTARPAAVVAVPGEVVVRMAPPPLRVEVVGVAPGPGYVWAAGHWRWEGGAYAWHRGEWMAPRPGYHLVAHEWRPVGAEWHYSPGHWVRG